LDQAKRRANGKETTTLRWMKNRKKHGIYMVVLSVYLIIFSALILVSQFN